MPGVLKLTSGQWYRTKTAFIFLSVSGTCLWVRLPLIILVWLLLQIAKNSGKFLDHSTRLCLLSSFLLSIPVPETHSVSGKGSGTWVKRNCPPYWRPSFWQVSHSEMNLWNLLCTDDKAEKGIHPGFETHGRHQQKLKSVVSVTPQKGLMPFQKFKQKTVTSDWSDWMSSW